LSPFYQAPEPRAVLAVLLNDNHDDTAPPLDAKTLIELIAQRVVELLRTHGPKDTRR